jgi:hypothetical protein
LWLIDHGAALYFHHAWHNWQEQATRPFVQVKDHVLLKLATELVETDTKSKQILTAEKIRSIVALVPDEWLAEGIENGSAAELREVYAQFLETRINSSHIFVKEAQDARERLI